MTLLSYYQSVAMPTLLALCLGALFLLILRKSSAATRQFISSATLFTTLAVGFMPFLPTRVRAIVPPTFPTLYSVIPAEATNAFARVPTALAAQHSSHFRFDLLLIVSGIVMTVSLLLGIRLMGSLLSVARMRMKALPASEMIRQLASHPVQIVSGLSSPIALGGFKPIILLPAEAEHWSEEQLLAVLVHEEAHIDNHDPDWQILAEVVCLVYWFNPLVWLMRRSMRNAAECAADDAVIHSGIAPSAYAEDLFEIATSIRRNRSSIAWTTFAASFFLPSYADGYGWKCAGLSATAVTWPDFWGNWRNIHLACLTPANVFMLLSPFLLLRFSHSPLFLKWWRGLSLLALGLVWSYILPLFFIDRTDLRFGCYVWTMSFLLLALAGFKLHIRKPQLLTH